jgi:hypothetical protein
VNLEKLNNLRDRADPIVFWLGAVIAFATIIEWAWRFYLGITDMTATWIQLTGLIILIIALFFKEWQVREQRKAIQKLNEKLFNIIEKGTINTVRALSAGEIANYREVHTELARLIDRIGISANNDAAADEMIRMLNEIASNAEKN